MIQNISSIQELHILFHTEIKPQEIMDKNLHIDILNKIPIQSIYILSKWCAMIFECGIIELIPTTRN